METLRLWKMHESILFLNLLVFCLNMKYINIKPSWNAMSECKTISSWICIATDIAILFRLRRLK